MSECVWDVFNFMQFYHFIICADLCEHQHSQHTGQFPVERSLIQPSYRHSYRPLYFLFKIKENLRKLFGQKHLNLDSTHKMITDKTLSYRIKKLYLDYQDRGLCNVKNTLKITPSFLTTQLNSE